MIKIALEGLIASGKSEVEKLLRKDFLVVDLDKVSNTILDNSKEILEEFKTLDRKKIASVVFSDSKKREKLEGIIYPQLRIFILDLFDKNQDKSAVFVSGALLYKKEFVGLFDYSIFVDAPYNLRLQRLIKRNNFSELEAKKRMNAQIDKSKKTANYIINNTGSIIELKNNLNEVLLKLNLIQS